MHDQLMQQIRDVTARYRQRRFWITWAVIALLLGATGWVLLQIAARGWISADVAAGALVATAVVLFVIDAVVSRFSFRNPRWVASQIEESFPTLHQRLLTALSLSGSATDEQQPQLGYLQTRVIREAHLHARQHAWAETVPSRGLRWGRLGGLISTAMLAVMVGLLIASDPSEEATGASRSMLNRRVMVEPGNVEIERGTGLAITARFAGVVPADVELESVDTSGAERRHSMARALSDPVFGVFVTDTSHSFDYRVATRHWVSERYRVDVFDYPDLVRSDAHLQFPSYTRQDDRIVEDAVRVSAVEGSELTWRCALNKPVARAELVDPSGNRTSLKLADGAAQVYQGTFKLTENQRWNLELVDERDRRNRYPIVLVANVIPNRPAEVKIAGVADVTVSPLQELPLAADIQDDFGVLRSGLSYSFADQTEREWLLGSDLAPQTKHHLTHLVDFEALGAVPDQLLTYYFWAEDVDAQGVVRRSVSDLFFADVRPFEEIFRQGEAPPGGQPPPMSPGAQQAEELLELQKQVVSATWNVLRSAKAELTAQTLEDVQVIEKSQIEVQEQLHQLLQQLKDDDSKSFAEAALTSMNEAASSFAETLQSKQRQALDSALRSAQASYEALLKLRAREFEVSRSQSSQSTSGSASQARRQQKIDQLQLENDESRYETQSQATDSAADAEASETRQTFSRLKDLARRQSDLNDQLTQLQSALEQAEDADEKKEIERRLQRLREQQEELLRESDELGERLQQTRQSQETRETVEQLEQARENAQQATESLRNNDASAALSAGTRAEQQFEAARDEFRKRAASEFQQVLEQMREAARSLEESQSRLNERLAEQSSTGGVGLRREEVAADGSDTASAQRLIEEQQRNLADLLEQMQETVQQAETSEPLLAEKLYEAFRGAQQRGIERQLANAAELQRRGANREARSFGEEASEGITQLREGVEEAATSVLGDPNKALERAMSQLEQLSRDLERELDERDPTRSAQRAEGGTAGESPISGSDLRPSMTPGQPQGQSSEGSGQEGKAQDAPPEDVQAQEARAQDGQAQDGQAQDGQAQDGQAQDGQAQNGATEESQSSQGRSGGAERLPADGEAAASARTPGLRPSAGQRPDSFSGREPAEGQQTAEGGGRFAADSPSASPVAGEGFREWTDSLREIEEMLEQPELRSQAAQIRDRARELRLELRRHAREPQWSLVDEMVAQPLRELKAQVTEEWMRRNASRQAPVPIDRDPVPEQFSEAVRRYYESLGSDR